MKEKNLSALLLAGLITFSAAPLAETIPCTHFAAVADETTVVENATSGECGENASFVLDSEGTLTISGTGLVKQPKELYEPEEDSMFLQVPKYSVKKIVIEEGITEIGMCAFNNLSKVTSLTLPESLEIIGANSFESCKSLKSVKIPDSVTSLEWYSFANCTSLEKVILPDNNEYICISPFANCYNLNNIVLGDNTTSIPQFLFSMCSGLKEFTVPDTVTLIDFGAFSNCENLTKVTLPDSIEAIYYCAFSGCSSLKTVTIPENVSEIRNDAFSDCPELTEILVAPENSAYTSKDGVLFTKDMTTLVQYPEGKGDGYVIPESVTNIYESAFSHCDPLTSITLGKNIKKIDDDAFEECVNLQYVKILNPNCELSELSIPEETTIYGYEGSTAQEYAEKYNRTFIAIENDDTQLTPTLPGDANCDGKVTIADAAAILQYLANPDKYKLSEQGAVNADIADTGNGITINDAVTIQKIDAFK